MSFTFFPTENRGSGSSAGTMKEGLIQIGGGEVCYMGAGVKERKHGRAHGKRLVSKHFLR